MYADITKPPAPLPQALVTKLDAGLTLLAPLSRRGKGPGLIILTPPQTTDDVIDLSTKEPSPFVKWAEEGYTVVQVATNGLKSASLSGIISKALEGLKSCEQCEPKGMVGLVAYEADIWNAVAPCLGDFSAISASIVYASEKDHDSLALSKTPLLMHVAGERGKPPVNVELGSLIRYSYSQVKSHNFASPEHGDFHYSTDAVAHTRNLQFLKPRMKGPYFDLESIWEEHTYYEFADRSVEHTMSTMVQEPYVNHIPTLTGGIGRSKLTEFYRHNFIFNNSEDGLER